MTIYRLILLILFFCISPSVLSQTPDWRKLVALESTREEVEKFLGKPDKYFETYGTYETELGRFSIWFSRGGL